jgi:polar amino acid transport system substrate-binding protein
MIPITLTQALLGVILLLVLAGGGSGCRARSKALEKVVDAAEARIGVMTGSIGEEIVRDRFPKAQVQVFDDVMDAVTAIKSGQLEAVVLAFPPGFQIAKRNADLVVLDEPLDNEDTAVALRKEDTALLQQVNRIIADLHKDGTLDAMHRRWFKPDLTPYEVPAIPLPTNGAPLRIGVSATREPLTFVDDKGEVSGHDGELARRIGLALGRPVEFSNMKFLALIPALQSGKIDMVVTGMNATEERRKSVAFSEPYFANAQVMLVRKVEGSGQRVMATFPSLGNRPTTGREAGSAAGKASKLDALSDKAIGVLSGSAGDLAARRRFAKARFDALLSAADAALALQARKIDAFVYDQSVLLNIVGRNPDLEILDEPVASLEIAGALRKDSTALTAEIDHALDALEKEGVLKSLWSKWVESKYSTVPPMPDPPTQGTRGILRLGTSPDMEPYTFVANGRIVGMDIELAGLLAQRLGRRLEVVSMNFDALIPALQAGKVDLALSNFNVTEERKKLIAYSRPYIRTPISALVRREGRAAGGSPGENGIEPFRRGRIGTLLGSAHSTWVSKNLPEATLLEFSSIGDIALAVKAGKVDVALSDSSSLRELMRQDPSFETVGDPLFGFPVAAGIRKDNGDLRTRFNLFLADLQSKGIYRQMMERWIEKADYRMPPLPPAVTNGVIRVGMTDGGMPFVGVQNGELVGFEIELVRRFAASIGRRVEFSNMDFAALIPALVSGKVDLIVASIFVTEERKQQIDFTDPYHEETTRAYRLKDSGGSNTATVVAKKSFAARVRESFENNVLRERRYLLLWDGLKTTVVISLGAALFGTLLGSLVCWMRMTRNAVLSGVAKVYIALLRGTPVLVVLMMIFYVVFASVDVHPVLVAILAFGLNFAAYAAEIFRSGIEGIDRGQSEAGIAMGFTRFQTFRFILLPQTLQRILPVYKGEFISLVKMTSIVGYIAVQDLTKASDIIRSRTFDAFFPLVMVAILYFGIAWVLMQGLEQVERRVDRRRLRRKEAQP